MKRETKVDDRLVKLEMAVVKGCTDVIGLGATLARLEDKIDNIDHVVRGNGAPGLREKLVENTGKISNIEKLLDEKVKDHREVINAIYAMGGTLIVGIITMVITHFVK